MYKFKASKYKNAFTANAKKEECISDLNVETPVTFGNHATASAKLVAFCVGSASGGKIMVFDINANGRLGAGPSLNAHSDSITDLEFSPFNHCRLATAGADNTVKIWDLPLDGITDNFSEGPIQTLAEFKQRPESISFHPIAENILAVAFGSMIYVYDIENGKRVFELDTGRDLIQCISWKKNGIHIAATTKDRYLLICDPRSGKVMTSGEAHANHKESRVIWAGESDKVFTTGFSSGRQKELKVWDVTGEKPTCLHTQDFGSGTGILMPFYDEDTGMVFVSAKGDSNISFLEFFEDKNPSLKIASQQLLSNQTKGMCMVSKLGVNAAECEVNRLFQLAQKMLVPVPWTVPRKTLREFPSDLFPDTASDEPGLTAKQWIAGENAKRIKTSLEPSKRKPLRLESTEAEKPQPVSQTNGDSTAEIIQESKPVAKEPIAAKNAAKEPIAAKNAAKEPEPAPKPKYAPFAGVRKSKFRHWKCTIGHPSSHVTRVEPISLSISTSSDCLRCSHLYAAVPMKGPGGQIAIIKISSPGRMTEDNSLTLQNLKTVTDLQWNPFNQSQLAVSLENSNVKIWNIPSNKFGELLEEPDLTFKGQPGKPMVLCFHPLAENVIASGDVESNIVIWDVKTGDTYFELSCDAGEIMSIAWSQNGKFIAASTKDKKLFIFEPRKSNEPIQVGPGPGNRSSRIIWACNDKFIAVSGFDRSSNRTISLHSTTDLASGPVSSENYTATPSVMMPHYDADSSTLFIVSKGDATIQSLEISENEPPHLFRIATFSNDAPVQGISLLSKKNIDVKKVEFAQGWCLSKNTLQPMSFTVPRVKMEYFQDDLFPLTSVTWEASMSASEWVNGGNKTQRKLDLKPSTMTKLSDAPPDEVKPKKYESYDVSTYKTDEEKKEELLEAMSGKLDLDKQLEQDTMEGVDEDEWDDY
uniref:coronin-7-like n=1 Tax=Styela clava TaxID=7725 RepID=UPI00193996FD|nr:coronin-7-like [Styela clava]